MRPFMHGRSVAFAYLGVALPGLAAVALYPSLIRNLGNDRFGALSLLLSIAMFFGTFDFGVGLAVTRYCARFDGRAATRYGIRRLLRHAILLQCAIGVVAGAVLVGAHQVWGVVRVPSGSNFGRDFNLAVIYIAISIPLALVAGVIRCALEGTGRYGVANLLRAPTTIGSFGAPIATSFLTTQIDLIILSLLVTRLVTTGMFIAAWAQWAPPSKPLYNGWLFRRFMRQARVLLSYGGWVMVGVAAGGVIVLGVLDRMLVGRLIGVGPVLNYAVPSDMVGRCLLIPSAISSVLITALTKQTVAGGSGLSATYRRGLVLVANQAGPLAAIIVLNSEWLLRILTHNEASPAATSILQGLATGFFVQALAHVPYCGLHAAGAPRAAGMRHLVELPFYALASYGVLATGNLMALGWIWAFWAVTDLGILLWLLRKIAPSQEPILAFAQVQLWVWLAIILSALTLSAQDPTIAWRSVASTALGAWFLLQILRIWNTRDLFGIERP